MSNKKLINTNKEYRMIDISFDVKSLFLIDTKNQIPFPLYNSEISSPYCEIRIYTDTQIDSFILQKILILLERTFINLSENKVTISFTSCKKSKIINGYHLESVIKSFKARHNNIQINF